MLVGVHPTIPRMLAMLATKGLGWEIPESPRHPGEYLSREDRCEFEPPESSPEEKAFRGFQTSIYSPGIWRILDV